MSSKIVIVDYGMGNILSVFHKFLLLGNTPIVSKDPNVIKTANKLVLPGVSHFAKAIFNLKSLGLFDTLNESNYF